METLQDHVEQKDSRRVGEVALALKQLLQEYDTVAYVLGIKQARTVRNWAEKGTQPSNPLIESQLRVTEDLALTVKDKDRPWVSSAWLISGNPRLGEESPATIIRSLTGDGEDERLINRLQAAAAHFASLED
jgi:hypothetical protein